MAEREHDREIASIRRRLAELGGEKAALETRLMELMQPTVGAAPATVAKLEGMTAVSPAVAKVALFRDLFTGRTDVFPVRWENARADRAGYAPACANEWVTGICGKPRVKCGECPNQAFIPVSDEVIEGHLRGADHVRPRSSRSRDFVVGVYPLLPDETCRFLAADFDGESWARDAVASPPAPCAGALWCAPRNFTPPAPTPIPAATAPGEFSRLVSCSEADTTLRHMTQDIYNGGGDSDGLFDRNDPV